MLSLPERGFSRSVRQHNCDLSTVCDWIEVSLVADEIEISRQQVCDIFIEQGIYDRSGNEASNFLSTFIDYIWSELKRRCKLAGNAAHFVVHPLRVERLRISPKSISSRFLLFLSCADYYEVLRKSPFNNYVEQGSLFEKFCLFSLNGQGWKVQSTGWASKSGAKKLKATVEAIASATGETAVNDDWVSVYKEKNEAGCDLVAYLAYPDGRTGRPLVLTQCASGADYPAKLGTPDLALWRKLIAFSVAPQRGFCTPRALDDSPFLSTAGQVDGWLLERHRLLRPFATGAAKLPKEFSDSLENWVRSRMKAIPRLR